MEKKVCFSCSFARFLLQNFQKELTFDYDSICICMKNSYCMITSVFAAAYSYERR